MTIVNDVSIEANILTYLYKFSLIIVLLLCQCISIIIPLPITTLSSCTELHEETMNLSFCKFIRIIASPLCIYT